jgi:hypothetical protein
MATLVYPPLNSNSQEVLYRHVNPNWLDADGVPSSQAFKPFDESNIHLSVDLSSKVSAEDSHNHFTKALNNPSVGVWGVTPAECAEVDLKAYAAPTPTNPAHGAIDFTGVELKKEARRRGKKLASRAKDRKRIYPVLSAAPPGNNSATSGGAGLSGAGGTAPSGAHGPAPVAPAPAAQPGKPP